MSAQTHLVSSLRSFSRASGVAVAIIGGLVLTGWVCSVELLRSGLSRLVTMKANTAFGFVLAGLSLSLLASTRFPREWFSAREWRCTRPGALWCYVWDCFARAPKPA